MYTISLSHSDLFSPPGYLFSDQPSCRYIPRGPYREGVTERHHTLRRAVHEDLGHKQGLLPFELNLRRTHDKSSTEISSLKFYDCLYFLLLILFCFLFVCLCRLLRRFSKLPNRHASAWASTECHLLGLPSKTGIIIESKYYPVMNLFGLIFGPAQYECFKDTV